MLIRGSDAKERERDSMRRFGCDGRGRVRYNYETGELKVSLIHELDHMAYVEVRTPEPIRDKVAELARSGLTPKAILRVVELEWPSFSRRQVLGYTIG
jgi:hypothetical protein